MSLIFFTSTYPYCWEGACVLCSTDSAVYTITQAFYSGGKSYPTSGYIRIEYRLCSTSFPIITLIEFFIFIFIYIMSRFPARFELLHFIMLLIHIVGLLSLGSPTNRSLSDYLRNFPLNQIKYEFVIYPTS